MPGTQPALASALSSQYRLLLRSPGGLSSASLCEECLKLADLFGPGGRLSLLRVLLEDLDFGSGIGNSPKVKVLGHVLGALVPNLPSLFCQAVLAASVRRESYLRELCAAVELPLERQVEIGLAVAQAPHPGWSAEGVSFLKEKVSELVERGAVLPEGVRHGTVREELTESLEACFGD
ncbi:unnamed protein product [Ostreobium quekettii]|uniref:Uncharacterized protein n=1 Tax=Ostreobium quekettii TaxID=121088 RepID=A0A8S1IRR1_9CHLO|nr:unnamed protein product [Ostreobium quekettii]